MLESFGTDIKDMPRVADNMLCIAGCPLIGKTAVASLLAKKYGYEYVLSPGYTEIGISVRAMIHREHIPYRVKELLHNAADSMFISNEYSTKVGTMYVMENYWILRLINSGLVGMNTSKQDTMLRHVLDTMTNYAPLPGNTFILYAEDTSTLLERQTKSRFAPNNDADLASVNEDYINLYKILSKHSLLKDVNIYSIKVDGLTPEEICDKLVQKWSK